MRRMYRETISQYLFYQSLEKYLQTLCTTKYTLIWSLDLIWLTFLINQKELMGVWMELLSVQKCFKFLEESKVKDINDIKAGHNKITEILEEIKSKSAMSTQQDMIQVPVAKPSTPNNSSMKRPPLIKEKEEAPPPTSHNNSSQDVPTKVNLQDLRFKSIL
eukprot:Seg2663.5 transcript_id=Seg2663.5/GoldUCD/mRNA.D3Y31 product="hypothetical protein" protein_id=Seg2663.5/GoldUCD/D3Y31